MYLHIHEKNQSMLIWVTSVSLGVKLRSRGKYLEMWRMFSSSPSYFILTAILRAISVLIKLFLKNYTQEVGIPTRRKYCFPSYISLIHWAKALLVNIIQAWQHTRTTVNTGESLKSNDFVEKNFYTRSYFHVTNKCHILQISCCHKTAYFSTGRKYLYQGIFSCN